MKNIFVVGSINKDYTISVEKLPLIGESKNGHHFVENQGGKGANQAIASKRLGNTNVYFIGAIGDDQNGKDLKCEIEKVGIDTSMLSVKKDINTGSCLIILDESVSDNMLVVDKGANNLLDVNDLIPLKEKANKDDILIVQLEINLNTLYEALKIAKEKEMFVIFNPAPFVKIDEAYYKYIDLVVLNETEAYLSSSINVKNIEDGRKVFNYFNQFNVKHLIITLGGNGSYLFEDNVSKHFDAVKTKVVDTTAAGDTYIGALAAKLAEGKSLDEAIHYASKASSITVSRMGAGKSIPSREEIK